MIRHVRAFGTIVFLALWTGSTPGFAQIVHGRVIEDGSGRPVPGAFVSLIRADSSERFSVLSASDGRFALRAAGAGTYRIVVERIGYATKVSPDLSLSAGESVTYTMVVPFQVVDLGGIAVETTARCRGGVRTGAETARLWEEVRKALELARWSGEQRVLRMEIVNTRRELDAATLRVQAAQEERKRGNYDGSPYRSIPLERLRQHGYIQQAPDGQYDYFAPDARVLLSDGFLADHCFRLEPAPAAEPGLIGLAFEPLPDQTLPDIAGVLWVDRGSAELRRIDFRYTRLPFAGADWPHVGGSVEFERLANGMWIVDQWRIRMPVAGVRNRFGIGQRTQSLTRLAEVGGRVHAVRTSRGELIAEAAGATIFGTVFDSIANQPLAGASIEIAGTGHRTTTGPDGGYRLAGLASGRYAITLRHTNLDQLGIAVDPVEVAVEAGQAVRVLLGTPSGRVVVQRLCAAVAGAGAGAKLVHGVVRGAGGGMAVPNAVVHLIAGDHQRQVTANERGEYRACLDSPPDFVRLTATLPGAARGAAEAEEVELRGLELARADLQILAVRAVELEPIVVTARRRGYLADVGFYDRARAGGGLFIEEQEIDRRRPSRLTDLLRGRPGLEVVRAGLNEDVRITTAARLGGGDCQPAVWLDGSLVRDGGEPHPADPYLSDIVSPNVVSAIEVFRRPAEIPPQYGGSSSACGVVLIWTRRGG